MSNVLGQNAPLAEEGEVHARLGWLVVPLGVTLLLGGATAWQSLQLSLWVDELHTAWASAGDWAEVVPRAAIGNQTPPYFVMQWWLGRTFGHSELVLRLPSLFAWCAVVALVAFALRQFVVRPQHRPIWLVLSLIALDRQQIFFATEARPYMLLSLVNLLGWLALANWLQAAGDRSRVAWLAWVGWVGCCIAALWLQPIAILFVTAQGLWVLWHSGPVRWPGLCLAAILVSVAILPMRYQIVPVWEERHAWAMFASDLRWQNILKQFPLLIVGGTGMLAALIGWCWPQARPSSTRAEDYPSSRMWLCGWAVPLGLVILLTAAEVVPLMHARYLFAATLPLALWTASMLARLPSGRLVALLVLGMIMLQAVQQGSVSAWLSGRLPVVDRGENWRAAAAHIQTAINRGEDCQIYCVSNLIEGAEATGLDDEPLRQAYLSMPMRSLYSVARPGDVVALPNDPRTWLEIVSKHAKPASPAGFWCAVRTQASASV